jgi:hypothetical protein
MSLAGILFSYASEKAAIPQWGFCALNPVTPVTLTYAHCVAQKLC